MSTYQARLAEVVQRDPRYTYEAYEFVFAALSHTQRLLGRVPSEEVAELPGPQYHVSGRELVEGIRDLAVRDFGLMARIVFRMWGINRTSDFGEIVFNLVQEELMSKTDQDSREDFNDVYDLDQALVHDFRIELDEAEWTR
jgi:uncharacterized repeat protein (TIGR04138 family)